MSTDLPQSAPVDWSTVRFRKSSYSGGGGNECVDVAVLPDRIGVRDSKQQGGPVLVFSTAAWQSFLADLGAGRFHRD